MKIKPDSGSSSFAGFNNWSIYNLENDSLTIAFYKTASSYLGLGWYMPGEGKLYKIAPVMQEGGKLIADEVITPGAFTCKNNVTNDGKNVTINNNVTIDFAEGVKWDFQDGEFKCGSSRNSNIPSPVVLTSSSRKLCFK